MEKTRQKALRFPSDFVAISLGYIAAFRALYNNSMVIDVVPAGNSFNIYSIKGVAGGNKITTVAIGINKQQVNTILQEMTKKHKKRPHRSTDKQPYV